MRIRTIVRPVVFALVLDCAVVAAIAQTTNSERPMSATLYAPEYKRIRGETMRNVACSGPNPELSLAAGMPGAPTLPVLDYFSLYGNWFRVQGGRDDRSVIQDLGAHRWPDSLQIPFVPPLPELKPGERRHVIIDAPYQDPDSLARRSTMEGVTSASKHDVKSDDDLPLPPVHPSAGKASVVSALDLEYSARVLAKVVKNHMYVVHVVNGQLDFYALIHVDALVKGVRCTVSWKRLANQPK